MKRFLPLIFLVLLLPGCAGPQTTVQEATAVNLTAKVVFDGLALLPREKLIPLRPAIVAAEAGRAELTRAATAGENDKARAALGAVNVALGDLSQAVLADKATTPATRPAAVPPPPADDTPTQPGM